MRLDEREVIAQHLAKPLVELRPLHRFAPVQCNRLAVFAHPHHVVTKISLHPLLLEIELDLRTANIVGEHAAHAAVKHRHPDHEAGNVVLAAQKREGKPTREAPQNTHKTGQRDHCIEQPHGERNGQPGELVDVFLNSLVRVIGNFGVAVGRATKARQFQLVKRMVGEPAL